MDPETYAAVFGAEIVVSEAPAPSYNVAPTDPVYAVAEHEGRRMLGIFRWGLVPWWAGDPRIGAKHINARAETVATRPAFKGSFAGKRCIVPVDGFYEWERRQAGKVPHYVQAADGSPLALAGLWASRRDAETGERLASCAIITTTPNELLRPIHDRMPAILAPGDWDRWLSPDAEPGPLTALLRPFPASEMTEYPVSTLVNRVENNFPECIAPLT